MATGRSSSEAVQQFSQCVLLAEMMIRTRRGVCSSMISYVG